MSDFKVTVLSNAPQAVSQIKADALKVDDGVVKRIRSSTLKTYGQMTNGSPVRTGNYQSNMMFAMNEKPAAYRITGARAGIPKVLSEKTTVAVKVFRNGKYVTELRTIYPGAKLRGMRSGKEVMAAMQKYYKPITNQHIREAANVFDGKRLQDIRRIFIYNDAAHAHLVERGGPKQKAHWVFARGEVTARTNLAQVQMI